MTTTRQEAERISETDDVASAIGYLVESHSANAAVDLVHAVMKAVVSDHIVDANKKVEPVAFRMRHHLETDERDWTVLDIRFLERNKHPAYVYELLYTNPDPPSELLMAAEDVLELFLRVWISDDGINLTPEEKGKLNALRIELNKFK